MHNPHVVLPTAQGMGDMAKAGRRLRAEWSSDSNSGQQLATHTGFLLKHQPLRRVQYQVPTSDTYAVYTAQPPIGDAAPSENGDML